MRCVSLALLAGCGSSAATPDGGIDAAPDAAASARACPVDPTLAVCLSFDGPTLATPHWNEGALALSAIVKDVTRIEVGTGGGAQLSAASELGFPANTAITGIVAIDARVRLEAELAPGTRVGVVDTDVSNPGMSLFIYAGTTTPHRIRCNIGIADVYADTTLVVGTFTELGCTCTNGNVAVVRDGVTLVELGGATTCQPATAMVGGLQIGQNNRSGMGLPPNEPLIGTIDRVRLWTAVPAQ